MRDCLQMTGRKGRVVSTENGSIQYESRSEIDVPLEILNLTEKQRFMDGEKVCLTGRLYTYIYSHCKPQCSMVHQCYKKSLKKTQVHDSGVTLTRHIKRFDAIATSCVSATPWQSLNRLPVGYWI